MSSSNNASEKTDKEMIRELKKELEVERHEHKMTKFDLQKVEEKMEQMGIWMESENDIMDFNTFMEKSRLESLQAENEGLKETLKTRDEEIGELERKLKDPEEMKKLERENHNLRMEMSTLKKTNDENIELLKTVNIEKTELKYELERQSEKVTDAENKWNRMRIEKESLEGDLQIFSQNLEEKTKTIEDCKKDIQDLMETIGDLMETLTSEQPGRMELMTKLEEQSDEMRKNIEARLMETFKSDDVKIQLKVVSKESLDLRPKFLDLEKLKKKTEAAIRVVRRGRMDKPMFNLRPIRELELI